MEGLNLIHQEIDRCIFKKTRLTQIVAFDSKFIFGITKDFKEKIKKTEYFSESQPYFKHFNKLIYDSEYAENNSEKIIVIESQISLSDILSKSQNTLNDGQRNFIKKFCNDNIEIIISLDSCGVNSARFDFSLDPIETFELIEITDITCNLIEDSFFPYLKKGLIDNEIIKEDILSKHMIYSIISCTESNIDPFNSKRDILGIAWKNKDYKTVDDKLLEKIIENDVAIHKKDIITVTPQAVLMVFPSLKDYLYKNYVEERINAIEVFWRQKILLKKMHYELDDLISNIDKIKEQQGIEFAIKEIQRMQITIQSELEVYRNIIISITYSYAILFDTLNKVFKTKNQYNFVQEKLETCKSIYEGLNEERRNNLMENIQWAVLIIGILALISTTAVGIYANEFKEITNLGILILILVFFAMMGFSKFRNI